MDSVDRFRDAIQSAGLIPPELIEPDGKLHRFPSNGKPGDDAGWYLLHGDNPQAGAFGDWRTGIEKKWRADGRALTPQQDAAQRAKIETARSEREAEQRKLWAKAAEAAERIWQQAKPAQANHAYLAKKGVKPHGARVGDKGALILPRCDSGGKLHSLQFITPDGGKQFLKDGRTTGCYFVIGEPKGAALYIAEGFATGAAIHEATGYPVVVAFSAGNLKPVALALREKHPALQLIICGDDDIATDGNPGITKATEAALAVGGKLAVPDFGANRPDGATDFNDMAASRGAEAVKRAVDTARDIVAGVVDTSGSEWSEPLPLVTKLEPEQYPIDALPDTIRAAVEEVQGFTMAPMALVASSALGALSLAIQGCVDMKRAEKLSGPVSLFVLTIADSGERKSTCDQFFTTEIRQYQKQQAELAKPQIEAYGAESAAWEAKQGGIKDSIRQSAKAGKSTVELEETLRELERSKPQSPRVPRLLRGDDTPENLAWSLSHQWPSGGIMSSEAGAILGAHGMGKESIMRNLSLLNILWDGGELPIGRRTSESFTVKNARLTVALQIQEATLRSFFERSGGLARGSGFLARFLLSWPESTQGYRAFTEAPTSWPALNTFNARIADILNQPVSFDADGGLVPYMISLTPKAKSVWVCVS